jgi:hypothetical protein
MDRGQRRNGVDARATEEARAEAGRKRRPSRRGAPGAEALEGRMVLSQMAISAPMPALEGGLAEVGILTGPGAGGFVTSYGPALAVCGTVAGDASTSDDASATDSAYDQLQKDTQALQDQLQALAAKSGVTIADLTSLRADEVAIAKSDAQVDPKAFNEAVSDLATAVVSGADTAEAEAAFRALFADSTIDQAIVDKAYADLVRTVQNSKVTADELTALTEAKVAIKADLEAIRAAAPDVPGDVDFTVGYPGVAWSGVGVPGDFSVVRPVDIAGEVPTILPYFGDSGGFTASPVFLGQDFHGGVGFSGDPAAFAVRGAYGYPDGLQVRGDMVADPGLVTGGTIKTLPFQFDPAAPVGGNEGTPANLTMLAGDPVPIDLDPADLAAVSTPAPALPDAFTPYVHTNTLIAPLQATGVPVTTQNVPLSATSKPITNNLLGPRRQGSGRAVRMMARLNSPFKLNGGAKRSMRI